MDDYTPRPREAELRSFDAAMRKLVAAPKERPVRSEEYRRLVTMLPCAHCGRQGRSQAAHSDSDGKAMSLKADDRTCYPACADSPGRVGCHTLIGTQRKFSKEHRRALETLYAERTRATIIALGAWPKGLQRWVREE